MRQLRLWCGGRSRDRHPRQRTGSQSMTSVAKSTMLTPGEVDGKMGHPLQCRCQGHCAHDSPVALLLRRTKPQLLMVSICAPASNGRGGYTRGTTAAQSGAVGRRSIDAVPPWLRDPRTASEGCVWRPSAGVPRRLARTATPRHRWPQKPHGFGPRAPTPPAVSGE